MKIETRLIAINKGLLAVYFLSPSYYVEISDAKSWLSDANIAGFYGLPVKQIEKMNAIEIDAFLGYLKQIKNPSWKEVETIKAITEQMPRIQKKDSVTQNYFIKYSDNKEETKSDDYFIKY